MSDPDTRDRNDIPHVIAPPPLIYGIPLVLTLLAHRWWPRALLPLPWPAVVGPLFLLASLLFLYPALHAFRQARTNPKPWKPTTALVLNGPYRITRNPMYVGFTCFYLGVTIWANAVWPLAALPVVLVVMDVFVIRREERYLTGKFGDSYRQYVAAVRRWL